MGKKILVTGAGGYIGRHVVEQLLTRGHEVSVVDFHTEGIDPRAKVVEANIFSGDENIYDQLGRPEVVLHMAWRDGFKHNSPAHIDDLAAHMHFTENLFKGGLKHFATMGTMHEVGYWEGAIDETAPCNPESLYGISKNALRQFTKLVAKQNDVLVQWIRAYYITGDDLHGDSIFSKLLKAGQAGQNHFPFTQGKNLYDFITVDELARQIAVISTQDKVTGIINACTGKPLSLAERVEAYIKENNLDITLDYGAYPDRPYDSPGEWGDATKVNEILTAAGEEPAKTN
ncbi:MAG: NAD(P)-dependent oxidoreductase [Mobiluncus porci]|uniref:NAD-dependent epimerase/dehydratase family protein n=1 Tax=Mobiluncus TaxID=2050 RepID=UPI0023F020E9|nr:MULTISPECIES: NAD(P)-dependent oxidoreductase [Mobiluncus]MCI6583985.1 NAD(P)-dependent oxidoreductase [Mobiluncus sp.]MDD7542503.1 NAD(P)-dependent oxidoreductase [Mobiluncus porci]MDY5748800.1 NAD(P)-dependent oxidoreductase [Mobiluncus porci]